MGKTQIETCGIPHIDLKFDMYFDESGFPGKFNIKAEDQSNKKAQYENFILAGVAFEHGQKVDLASLKNIFKKMTKSSEFKSKLFFSRKKNKAPNIFVDKNINDLFEWIKNNNGYIHYSVMNNIYYSLTDIIDSFIDVFPEIVLPIQFKLKNDLFYYVLNNYNEFKKFFVAVGYPNITNSKLFCKELIKIINKNKNKFLQYVDSLNIIIWCLSIFASENIQFSFLSNREPFTAINDYSHIYHSRIINFYNCEKTFDNQNQVKNYLSKNAIYYKKKEIINFKFVDSKKDLLVQLSDFLAGFIKNTFIFLDYVHPEIIKKTVHFMADKKINNLKTFDEIVEKSLKISDLFIQSILPTDLMKNRETWFWWISNWGKELN
ncbi:MAG: DUF3800 domain-containing protein [Mycoplasmoidaceae bacterium]